MQRGLLEWNLAWVEAPESQMCVLLRSPWSWAEVGRALVVSSWNRHVCEDLLSSTIVVEQSWVCRLIAVKKSTITKNCGFFEMLHFILAYLPCLHWKLWKDRAPRVVSLCLAPHQAQRGRLSRWHLCGHLGKA